MSARQARSTPAARQATTAGQTVRGELRKISDRPDGKVVGMIEIPICSDPDGMSWADTQRLRVITDMSRVMSEDQLRFAQEYLDGKNKGLNIPDAVGHDGPVVISGRTQDDRGMRIDVDVDPAGLADTILAIKNEYLVQGGSHPVMDEQGGPLHMATKGIVGDGAMDAHRIEEMLRESNAAKYMLASAGGPVAKPPKASDIKLASRAMAGALKDTIERLPKPGQPVGEGFRGSAMTYRGLLDEQFKKLGVTEGAKNVARACTVGFVRVGSPGTVRPSIHDNIAVYGFELKTSQDALDHNNPSEVYGTDVTDAARGILNDGRTGLNTPTPVFDRMHKEAALSMPLTGENHRFVDVKAVPMDYTPVAHDLGRCTVDDVDALYKTLAQKFVKAAEKHGQVPECLSADEYGNLSVADIDILASDIGHEDVLKFGHQMNRYLGMHVAEVKDMPTEKGNFTGIIDGTAAWLDFEDRSNKAVGQEFFFYDLTSGKESVGYELDFPDGPDLDDDDHKYVKSAGTDASAQTVSAYERMRRMLELQDEEDEEDEKEGDKDGLELC